MIIRTNTPESPNNFWKAIALVAITTLRENPRDMRWFFTKHKLLCVAILGLGLSAPLAFWFLVPDLPTIWLAQRLQQQMERADKEQIELNARQLALLGRPGWESLLIETQSKRPETRAAARLVLTETIDSWKLHTVEQSSPRAVTLASLLVAQLKEADKDAVHYYADLAERLIEWPTAGNDGISLVYDCERVLRTARQAGWPIRIAAEPEQMIVSQIAEVVVDQSIDSLPANTGAAVTNAESGEDDPAAPQLTLTDPTTSVAGRATVSEPAVELSAPIPGEQSAASSSAVSPNAEPAKPAVVAQPDWQKLELRDVLELLAGQELAAEAEVELKRRGLNEVNLRIARAAADENPDNRLKLIRMLPELSGVDAIGWLMVLAEDRSSRVRFAAVQLLSTSNDTRIQQRFQQLDEVETDEQVRVVLRRGQSISR